jgi:hypothetical protein
VDAVLLLPTEVFFKVVNYNCRLQTSSNSRKVFNVVNLLREIILQMHSMLSVQSVRNHPPCVQSVQHFVGIQLVGSCEDNYFIKFAQLLKELRRKGPGLED